MQQDVIIIFLVINISSIDRQKVEVLSVRYNSLYKHAKLMNPEISGTWFSSAKIHEFLKKIILIINIKKRLLSQIYIVEKKIPNT